MRLCQWLMLPYLLLYRSSAFWSTFHLYHEFAVFPSNLIPYSRTFLSCAFSIAYKYIYCVKSTKFTAGINFDCTLTGFQLLCCNITGRLIMSKRTLEQISFSNSLLQCLSLSWSRRFINSIIRER